MLSWRRDTGLGIWVEELNRFFASFFRVFLGLSGHLHSKLVCMVDIALDRVILGIDFDRDVLEAKQLFLSVLLF